eukprot:CAMPEP_0204140476 /NCGR_PEP_ID=MMETSP0361-20130328/19000_1 /ASSEMBLY_ACC=CAM_ASM_000343 /TAXON_ID=268821 /ORGANISM="Scrippsiella Hangoei, Strain SHTV-5" /LENGTH=64 /DNA_ID=CAMNT_0051094287 /DNA_START=226 /DNA_END=420 /DNA_ORIENTATION=+
MQTKHVVLNSSVKYEGAMFNQTCPSPDPSEGICTFRCGRTRQPPHAWKNEEIADTLSPYADGEI